MSRTTMLPLQFKLDLLHHPACPTRATINEVPCVNSMHRKGFLVCVCDISKTSFSKHQFIHIFPNLSLLHSFKEWHHQLTHHLVSSAFESELKSLDVFFYQNVKELLCFYLRSAVNAAEIRSERTFPKCFQFWSRTHMGLIYSPV